MKAPSDAEYRNLVSCPSVILVPRHVHPAGDVWRLLLQGHHQVHRLVVKPWCGAVNANVGDWLHWCMQMLEIIRYKLLSLPAHGMIGDRLAVECHPCT